jgi:hypothetical protein
MPLTNDVTLEKIFFSRLPFAIDKMRAKHPVLLKVNSMIGILKDIVPPIY